MKKLLFLPLFLTLILGCKTAPEYITIDGYTFEEFLAPGVVKIAENLYADERELSNLDYKEFMFWVLRVFGANSPEHLQILPDTNVWFYQNHYDSLHLKYLQTPEFNDYPLVGISLEQAKIYSNWRTERVAEMILVNEKLIKLNPEQNKDNYFTIDKYLSGTYEATIKIKPILVLPKYTVPTIEEWEIISGINSNFKFGIDSLDKHNKNLIRVAGFLFNTQEYFFDQLKNKDKLKNSKFKFTPTTMTKNGCKNIYGLINTIGNVSELVDDAGISKGGDWFHPLEELDLENDTKTNIPNCWTGFRNICRLEIRKR